jgi:hypothetical protein
MVVQIGGVEVNLPPTDFGARPDADRRLLQPREPTLAITSLYFGRV